MLARPSKGDEEVEKELEKEEVCPKLNAAHVRPRLRVDRIGLYLFIDIRHMERDSKRFGGLNGFAQ